MDIEFYCVQQSHTVISTVIPLAQVEGLQGRQGRSHSMALSIVTRSKAWQTYEMMKMPQQQRLLHREADQGIVETDTSKLLLGVICVITSTGIVRGIVRPAFWLYMRR